MLKISIAQRKQLCKVWKAGKFCSFELELENKSMVLKKWEMMGIIRRVRDNLYVINRDVFAKLDREGVQDTILNYY